MALTFLNFYLHANRLKYKLHLTSCQVVLRTFYFFKNEVRQYKNKTEAKWDEMQEYTIKRIVITLSGKKLKVHYFFIP
jgi:hypothetical protein